MVKQMIKVIDGDLFNTKAKFICHQVNCQKRMGSGVALQVKNKYPHVYKEYCKVASPEMLGKVQIIPINEKYLGYDCGSLVVPYTEQWICNMFAQDKYGYDGKLYTDLAALRDCFSYMNARVMEKNNNCGAMIAMPWKIGCCRGGADWKEVYNMIDEIFKYNTVELWRLDNG